MTVQKTRKKIKKPKMPIGWREWCALPDLGLPCVKAKIDTGARTSALHAYDITIIRRGSRDYVRFNIHPLTTNYIARTCIAPLVDQRVITSSNGERESRPVILTTLDFGLKKIEAELTLTSRHKMSYRMLLGLTALRRGRFVIDPSKSFLLGERENPEELY